MRLSNCAVLIGQGRSQSIGRKMKPSFPCSGQLKWHKQEWHSVVGFSVKFFLIYRVMKSPHQQMTVMLLLFIVYGPLIDHGEYIISADKFLLRVHIKWIFFFSVSTEKKHMWLSKASRVLASSCSLGPFNKTYQCNGSMWWSMECQEDEVPCKQDYGREDRWHNPEAWQMKMYFYLWNTFFLTD